MPALSLLPQGTYSPYQMPALPMLPQGTCSVCARPRSSLGTGSPRGRTYAQTVDHALRALLEPQPPRLLGLPKRSPVRLGYPKGRLPRPGPPQGRGLWWP
jgi:hypothetical protein